MEKTLPKKAYFIHLGIILLLYLLIRLPLLDKPLQHDEVYNTFVYLHAAPFSQTAATSLSLEQPLFNWKTDGIRQIAMHPPFLSAFYYCWIRIFGDGEISLHLPVIILGLAGLVLLYFLGSIIFGSAVGFFAALATSFSIAHIEYSTQAIHAIFEVFILLFSLFLLYKYISTKEKKFFYALPVINLFGILIYYHYWVYLTAQTLILWFYRRELKPAKINFILVFIGALLFIAFVFRCFMAKLYNYDFWMLPDFKTLVNVIVGLPTHIIR